MDNLTPAMQKILDGNQDQPTQPTDTTSQYTPAMQKILAVPTDVTNAKEKLGNVDDNGLCQKFVEEVTGSQQHYGSAVEAWNAAVKQGTASADYQNAPAGSAIYFSPDKDNGNFGHTAIADGKGNIIGATYHGVTITPLDKWMSLTGQKPLGFIPQK